MDLKRALWKCKQGGDEFYIEGPCIRAIPGEVIIGPAFAQSQSADRVIP
jgi:hypothetical protein